MLQRPFVANAFLLIVRFTGGLLKNPRNRFTPLCFAADKNQFCALMRLIASLLSFKNDAARCHSSLIPLLSPWLALPAPMLYLHKLRPIPFGLPSFNVSVLKSKSAIAFFFSSGQLPTNWQDHASDAAKLSIV